MKLKKWMFVAAMLFVGAGAGVAHRVAQADSSVDCSGVQQWKSERNYKKGDLAWHSEGANYASKHQCILDKCVGSGIKNEPGAFSEAWKNLGMCKSRPSS